MAKKPISRLHQTGASKAFTKCIKLVKSEKTGAYTFKTDVVPSENVKEFFAKK